MTQRRIRLIAVNEGEDRNEIIEVDTPIGAVVLGTRTFTYSHSTTDIIDGATVQVYCYREAVVHYLD